MTAAVRRSPWLLALLGLGLVAKFVSPAAAATTYETPEVAAMAQACSTDPTACLTGAAILADELRELAAALPTGACGTTEQRCPERMAVLADDLALVTAGFVAGPCDADAAMCLESLSLAIAGDPSQPSISEEIGASCLSALCLDAASPSAIAYTAAASSVFDPAVTPPDCYVTACLDQALDDLITSSLDVREQLAPCGDRSACGPYPRGGVSMVAASGAACLSAFTVRLDDGRDALLTSGRCLADDGEAVYFDLYRLGTATARRTQGTIDAAVVPLAPGWPQPRTDYQRPSGELIAITAAAAPTLGETLCTSTAAGERCGTVTDLDLEVAQPISTTTLAAPGPVLFGMTALTFADCVQPLAGAGVYRLASDELTAVARGVVSTDVMAAATSLDCAAEPGSATTWPVTPIDRIQDQLGLAVPTYASAGTDCGTQTAADVDPTDEQCRPEPDPVVQECVDSEGRPGLRVAYGDCVAPPTLELCADGAGNPGLAVEGDCTTIPVSDLPSVQLCDDNGVTGVDIDGQGCTTIPVPVVPTISGCDDDGRVGLRIDGGSCLVLDDAWVCFDGSGNAGVYLDEECTPIPELDPTIIQPCGDGDVPGVSIDGSECITPPVPSVEPCTTEGRTGFRIDGGECVAAPSILPCEEGDVPGLEVDGECHVAPIDGLPGVVPCSDESGGAGYQVGDDPCVVPPTITACDGGLSVDGECLIFPSGCDEGGNPGIYTERTGCVTAPLDSIEPCTDPAGNPGIMLEGECQRLVLVWGCSEGEDSGVRVNGGECATAPITISDFTDPESCTDPAGNPGIIVRGDCVSAPIGPDDILDLVPDPPPPPQSCTDPAGNPGIVTDGDCQRLVLVWGCSEGEDSGVRVNGGSCTTVPITLSDLTDPEPCTDQQGNPGIMIRGDCVASPVAPDEIVDEGTALVLGLVLGTVDNVQDEIDDIDPPPPPQACTDPAGNPGVQINGQCQRTVILWPCSVNGESGVRINGGSCISLGFAISDILEMVPDPSTLDDVTQRLQDEIQDLDPQDVVAVILGAVPPSTLDQIQELLDDVVTLADPQTIVGLVQEQIPDYDPNDLLRRLQDELPSVDVNDAVGLVLGLLPDTQELGDEIKEQVADILDLGDPQAIVDLVVGTVPDIDADKLMDQIRDTLPSVDADDVVETVVGLVPGITPADVVGLVLDTVPPVDSGIVMDILNDLITTGNPGELVEDVQDVLDRITALDLVLAIVYDVLQSST